MELYIKVSFWSGIVGLAVRAITLMVCDYPRSTKHSIGEDVVLLLMSAAIVVWAWRLVYT